MLLIALDIGAYSVKAIALDPKRKYLPVAFHEERLADHTITTRPPETQFQEASEGIEADVPTGKWHPSQVQGGEPSVVEDDTEAQDEEVAPVSMVPVVEPDEDGVEPWVLAVQTILAKLETNGEGVILAMPGGKSFSLQVQDLPFSEHAKVARILPAMLGPKLPFGLDELLYDFFINEREPQAAPDALSQVAAQPEAFVGVARKADMQQFLMTLQEHEINPSLVGIPELMLRYLAESYVPESQHQTVALLDMGHDHTLVHVIERGKTVLARSIRHGGHHVTEAIANRFKATYEEAQKVKQARGAILPPSQERDPSLQALSDAIEGSFQPLLRDLRRSFQALYARERVEITQVYVFGGNSRIQNLPEHLAEKLGVPVSVLSLKGLVEGEEELGVDAPAKMHTALAMALQVVRDRAGERGVNLRQGAFSYKGRSSYLNAQLKRLGMLAAFLLLLLGGALFLQKRDLDTQEDAMRAAVAKETKKVFGKPLYKSDAIKKRVETQETSEGGFVPKMSAYEVFFELTSRIRPNVKLDLSRIEVDAERNLIQLYGTTTTPQAVDDIVSDLEQLECLKSIKKDKLQVKKEDEVNFELQIASACS